jgi:hypothetical protein
MLANIEQALLVLSVDIESPAPMASREQQREVRNVAHQMIRLLDKHQLAATWAVADPGAEWAIAQVFDANVPHELAIQGNAVWPHSPLSRVDFAGKLYRNLESAARHEIRVRSIVGLEIAPEHSDLLVKNEITTLRSPRTSYSRAVQWSEPRSVRFGVWNFPESCRFPLEKSWISDLTTMSFQRAVRAAAAGRRSLHVAMDARRVAQSPVYHLKCLEGLLECITKYRHSRQLVPMTLHGVATTLAQRPLYRSSCSILRAA